MSRELPDIDSFLLIAPRSEPPLAGWYAAPLTPDSAALLHTQAGQAQRRQLVAQDSPFAPRLAELIAAYWLGRAIDLEYRSLLATAPLERRALVELVYGQLLISRKLSGAQEHLKRGFMLATPMLQSAEYFSILRCHELLGALVLADRAAAPQTLPELLNEARIIKKLQPASGHLHSAHNEDDTLG